MTQKLTDAMFTGTLASSKLTGAMGNNDGSALTGVGGDGATDSANDPAVNTNPSGGVGTLWANHTSGELYVCTDATANANVWTNVGDGEDDIEPLPFFQGTQHGYVAGGDPDQTRIERFSLTSQANSVDIGDLATNAVGVSGGKSSSYGFVCGGDSNPGPAHGQISSKYAFASSTSGSTHGTLTVARYSSADASSETHVYVAGGDGSSDNVIEKLASASNANATDVGDLLNNIRYVGGNSSTTHGYVAGGFPSNNVIQKWSFSTDGNATDVGDLVTSRRDTQATSDVTHGHNFGGFPGQNNIEKFPFASDSNATDVGDMTTGGDLSAGVSTEAYSYCVGGRNIGNVIQRWSNSSANNAVDWADLTNSKNNHCSTQQ